MVLFTCLMSLDVNTLPCQDTWGETRSHKSFALVLPIDPFIRTQAKAKQREEFC